MAQTMTTSPMTEKQVERAVEIFRAQLRKHAPELSSDAVQHVFGQSELGREWLEVLRTRVEAISNLIVRLVKKVNRSCSPQEMLDATGRKQYTDRKVVDSMPHGEGDEAEVVFFKPDLSERDGYISDDDLEKEYELRGLIPADPYSVARVNTDDLTFADEKPHGTHWKDADGKWCFAAFVLWGDGRSVGVSRDGSGWGDGWWFAGVRKAAKA